LRRERGEEGRNDGLVSRLADASAAGLRVHADLAGLTADVAGPGELVHVPSGIGADGEVVYYVCAVCVCSFRFHSLAHIFQRIEDRERGGRDVPEGQQYGVLNPKHVWPNGQHVGFMSLAGS
jgi:hypothetical protein